MIGQKFKVIVIGKNNRLQNYDKIAICAVKKTAAKLIKRRMVRYPGP